jgi:hypothetical protein
MSETRSDGSASVPDFIMEAVAEIDELSRFGRMVDLGFLLGASLSTILGLFRDRLTGIAAADDAIEGLRPLVEELEPYAAAESAKRMPYLRSLLLIRYVTIVETVVHDAVVESLQSVPEGMSRKELLRIRGPIVELLAASPAERAEFLATALGQEVKAPLQSGVAKFEVLLEAVGLGGTVDSEARKLLFELLNVRNVLVHKRGRVDARFLESCPWFTHRVGDSLQITTEMSERYRSAAIYYLIEILERWLKRGATDGDLSPVELLKMNALQKLRQSGSAG